MLKNNKLEKNKYEILVAEGIKLANQQELVKAENIFCEAINLDKKKHEAYINLSNVYILQNQKEKSIELLTNYISKYKFNENIANYAGELFYNYNYISELKNLFNICNLNKKENTKTKKYLYFIQGKFFERNQDFSNAKKSYLKSISCDQLFFQSYSHLLSLLEKTNDLENLKLLIENGLKNFDEDNNQRLIIFYKAILLNRQKKFKVSQEIIKSFDLNDKFLENKYLHVRLLDLNIKNLEKLGSYSEAYNKAKEKNDVLLSINENKKFNGKIIFDNISKYKKFYTKKNINIITKGLNHSYDENLVFLVGFPRSGTTLLDTILRTHSRVKVLEEKPYILELRHNFFKNKNNDLSSLLNIKQSEKDKIRNDYFKKITDDNNDLKKVIIDKFPLSIIELGFIKCIFPNSKIILSIRHPYDVLISCFFSSFKINDAMINFLNWNNTINFYDRVFDLFEFYESELDLKYLSVKYEEVVGNFKSEIKLLINFLGLQYEDKLENFYNTAKKRSKIFTPSYSQVVNPLYTTSIGRWNNYAKFINTHKKLDKWIEKFNY
tara:strand:+ start:246 stop:1898 length:1653 start_codon:yes stop_codon:yes gene_type:complete